MFSKSSFSSCLCVCGEINEGEMTICVMSSKNVNIWVSYDESTQLYHSHNGACAMLISLWLIMCLCLVCEYQKSACSFSKICAFTFPNCLQCQWIDSRVMLNDKMICWVILYSILYELLHYYFFVNNSLWFSNLCKLIQVICEPYLCICFNNHSDVTYQWNRTPKTVYYIFTIISFWVPTVQRDYLPSSAKAFKLCASAV